MYWHFGHLIWVARLPSPAAEPRASVCSVRCREASTLTAGVDQLALNGRAQLVDARRVTLVDLTGLEQRKRRPQLALRIQAARTRQANLGPGRHRQRLDTSRRGAGAGDRELEGIGHQPEITAEDCREEHTRSNAGEHPRQSCVACRAPVGMGELLSTSRRRRPGRWTASPRRACRAGAAGSAPRHRRRLARRTSAAGAPRRGRRDRAPPDRVPYTN